MSYSVKITPKVKEAIRGWGFQRRDLLEVLNRLYTALAADPDGLLNEQVVPFTDVFTYPFTIPAVPPALQAKTFTFFIKRDDAKKSLAVIAAYYLQEGQDTN